jgi:dihydrofolate reductase
MIISLLVAASTNNVIGKDNQLLWHLPNDMKFFKNTTWGMPVIMGRKTFESLNKKALNGRINIIITKHDDLKSDEGKIDLANSIEESITKAKQTDCKEVFVIGGGEIFKLFMGLADRIYMTRVEANLEGDTYFPEMDSAQWSIASSTYFPSDEKHAYPYSFQLWKRKEA